MIACYAWDVVDMLVWWVLGNGLRVQPILSIGWVLDLQSEYFSRSARANYAIHAQKTALGQGRTK